MTKKKVNIISGRVREFFGTERKLGNFSLTLKARDLKNEDFPSPTSSTSSLLLGKGESIIEIFPGAMEQLKKTFFSFSFFKSFSVSKSERGTSVFRTAVFSEFEENMSKHFNALDFITEEISDEDSRRIVNEISMVTTKLFSVFEDIVEINEQILERKVIISK
jgi:hypothetical protein